MPAKHNLTMSKNILNVLAVASASALALTGCGGQGSGNSPEVEDFVVEQTIKQAERVYHYSDSSISGYAYISAWVMWPDKLGGHDLHALQDTLIARTFNVKAAGQSIDATIKKFVGNPEGNFLEGMKWEVTDSLPAGPEGEAAWFVNAEAKMTSISNKAVNYTINNNGYSGGAHPYYGSTTLTYSLIGSKVMTASNIFLPGTLPQVMEVVKRQLANDLGTTPDRLAEAGIFTDQLENNPGDPYLDDNGVVFHYNPYDIAPYSMGMIDVNVWAGLLADYLSPEAKELLDRLP